MKQILQSLKTGLTEVAEVPCPNVENGHVLIRSSRSLISSGTERMLVSFGRANLLEKARLQPDKVRMVLDKVRTDGLLPTIDALQNKLDQPLALGYCNVGTVLEVGAGVTHYSPGDRVVSNGKHAAVVCVPTNLCARVPDDVPDDHAAFTVLGAIALQGVRLAEPTLGESVVVIGLGLIGLMTVQLLRAHGCRVLGIDLDRGKVALARRFGAEAIDVSAGVDPLVAASQFSRGRGVDAVLITAGTKSNEPMHQAAVMSRQRGRIVLVGIAGLELSRDDFYKKELSFRVSCSYGPGRYDPDYEEKGRDYPFGFVRWTEQRNLEAVLDMMAEGRLDVESLISHRIGIDEAESAYDLVSGNSPSLGILLQYPEDAVGVALRTVCLPHAESKTRKTREGEAARVSFVGSGNYATAILIPAFKSAAADLRIAASRSGVSGLHAARSFGFAETTTDTERVFADSTTNTVVITTRHNSHAGLVLKALSAGKNAFVEKPLCLTIAELGEIEALHSGLVNSGATPRLMVGFNRRFAPHIIRIKALLAGVPGPKAFVMTVNAGFLPADHWTQDADIGGGRVLGEGCHFVDLLRFLAGAPFSGHHMALMRSATGDTATIQLSFVDGSMGTVHYFANGSKSYPKERLEVFAAGRVLQMDNYRTLRGYGWAGFRKMRLWRQDKGQKACAAAFVQSIERGLPSPIPFDEILEVSRMTIHIAGAGLEKG